MPLLVSTPTRLVLLGLPARSVPVPNLQPRSDGFMASEFPNPSPAGLNRSLLAKKRLMGGTDWDHSSGIGGEGLRGLGSTIMESRRPGTPKNEHRETPEIRRVSSNPRTNLISLFLSMRSSNTLPGFDANCTSANNRTSSSVATGIAIISPVLTLITPLESTAMKGLLSRIGIPELIFGSTGS